tara:strand:+ start:183 stop:338 length:156 start_codon:yes stop_codon:yes gene_type:complete
MVENYSTVTDLKQINLFNSKNGTTKNVKEIIISFTLSINNIILRKKRGSKK